MTTPFFELAALCWLLCLVLFVAALPLLAILEVMDALQGLAGATGGHAPGKLAAPRSRMVRWLAFLGLGVITSLVAGLGLALFFTSSNDPAALAMWGRLYGSLLHLLLAVDFFVLIFGGLLLIWPKAGAVAYAAFRESVRQPMYWLLTGAGVLLLFVGTMIPYFTFTVGDELKMVRELGFETIMLAAVVFGVMAASTSISEEIEGRTAITLMSKPVSRRQFLLGKFAGILLAALCMTVLLGWVFIWTVQFKIWHDPNPDPNLRPVDPAWVMDLVRQHIPPGEASALVRGIGLWADDAGGMLAGLIISFCQVMVLIAIAVALATRLPIVVNLPICLIFYFLGHLTPILKAVSQGKTLIKFMADLFDTILPGLELFDMSPAIVRDTPLPPGGFALYTMNVSLYAVMYTAIALLFGLILFEDRDLA
jgi:ABC-type transport system involved in multi-copper enzyme maturation permease subunit